MAFTPTTWIDGTTAITATQLNRIETGVDDAHAALPYAGRITDTAGVVAITGPTGWTVTRMDVGLHRVTHGLGTTAYVVVPAVDLPGTAAHLTVANLSAREAAYFQIQTRVDTGSGLANADVDFSFVLVPIT